MVLTYLSNNFSCCQSTSPTKVDTDVLLAIGETEISADKYPCVWKWMKGVLSYSTEDRNRLCYLSSICYVGALQMYST